MNYEKNSIIKKSISSVAMFSLMIGSFGFAFTPTVNAAVPNWNTTGDYVVNMQFEGSDYAHDMSLTQDSVGALSGDGGSPAGANVYTWAITSGLVDGDAINLTANYTATPDAVTPQTVLTLSGVIAPDGSMSGTWSDNYQGGTRTGAFMTTSGHAIASPENSPYVVTNMATNITSTDATLMVPTEKVWQLGIHSGLHLHRLQQQAQQCLVESIQHLIWVNCLQMQLLELNFLL